MNEITKSNIKQLLNSFNTFVQIMEDSIWIRSAEVEDIKIAFKLGNFIEKTVQNFESKTCFTEFLEILNKWWKTENRTKVYNSSYYQYACDKLLTKFFEYVNISESSLDIAVRVYSSLYSKERMQNVISHLILTSSSIETIYQFINNCIFEIDSQFLEYQYKLSSWTDMINTGNENIVKSEIKNMLSLYKIESSLPILIGILSLQNTSELEKSVQNIVSENLLEKMLDRSLLSKQFWLTIFKEINLNIICKACTNDKDFLNSLFSFIVYTGSMMVKENDVWISDPNICLCPQIGYYDILEFIKSIGKINTEITNFVAHKLIVAKKETESDIWDQINCQLIE